MSEYTKFFAENLGDLIAESGKKISELAKEIGISSGALSKYQNDESAPGAEALIKISNYFGVSVDWLLGNSETRLLNGEVSQVCNYLGLSEEAVQVLADLKDSPSAYRSYIAEYILTCSRLFEDTIEYLSSCAWSSVKESCLGYIPPSDEDKAAFKKELMEREVPESFIDSNLMSEISTPIINLGEEFHESIMFSQVIKTLTRLHDQFKEEFSEDEDFVDAVVREYVDSHKTREGYIRVPRRKK